MPIFMRLPRYHYWIRRKGGGCSRRSDQLRVEERVPCPSSFGVAGRGRPALHWYDLRSRPLVLAWLLWRQIARLSDSIQIQAAGRKLRDLPAAPGWQFHVENLGADQTPNGAFVHGEKMAAHPVPALEVVGVVNADHHFQLGLSPEAGAIRSRQSDSGVEVRQLEFAVTAKQNHSRSVVRVFAKIIIRLKLKAHIVRARHFVGGVELQPFPAGGDTVRFALVRAHGAALGASQCYCANHKE